MFKRRKNLERWQKICALCNGADDENLPFEWLEVYIFVHKDSKQRVLAENYKLLTKEDGKQEVKGIGDERGDGTFYNHVGILSDKTEEMNVFEYNCVKMEKGKEKKVHFQWITDILMQLYLAWNPLVKEIKQSIKNTSSRLLKSFCRQPVTDEDVHYILRYTMVYLE